MRQQLEKIIDSYEPRINAREQIYVVGDLETLSSSVFYTGNPGGSYGRIAGSANYIKMFPNGDQLRVHAPNGTITGAKYNEQPINNYEASMIDLREGTIKKNTGGTW